MKKKNLVPPDGGWGWVIVLAFAIFNTLIIPIVQNFALVFRSTFKDIGLSPINESFIVTSGLAIGLLGGLSYGPLLKRFHYRKVCLVSAVFTCTGVISMMFAHKMVHFLITYGCLASFGVGMGMSGYSLAINSYFLKKRSFATGFAFTLTSLGSIAMPQLLSFLLTEYEVEGTVLILGGICLNTFVSALLLQPVKWHLKEEIVDDESQRNGNASTVYTINIEEPTGENSTSNSNLESHTSVATSTTTISSISSDPNLKIVQEERTRIKRILYNIVHIFDLSLLKDRSFLNLLFGLAMASFAEQAFSTLTPFILHDLDMTIPEIAMFLSVLSVTDLIFRFVTPFIGNYFKQTAKSMCMISFCLLIITRYTLLLHTGEYHLTIVIGLGIGVAKGVRTVYWMLIIPEYVPLKFLPSASGLHMVLNGLLLLVGGPLLGVAKEITGSYVNCIYIINSITMLSFAMWTTEILYCRWLQRKTEEVTKL